MTSGRVTVNGRVVTSGGKVDPLVDVVTDGIVCSSRSMSPLDAQQTCGLLDYKRPSG